ncbi:MAG: DUF433 domain-containing protein [Caldilineaceae bacterium SB0668_bin_21]|nr:DUF433 domain-containing protein [Caldilineaceae bacterium SB0668_bin_21]MYC20377.1 DUF433 domain-containing protein [Caldilineaceae bacterium SB0662_bin_25]
MTDWESCKAVERNPGKLGGAWVFQGTRVPVSALFENLRDGATVEQFLAWFPGVEKWMVEAALEHEVKALTASARP